ncbi:phospholipase D-like domain-containing protein [Denitromonas halophila]|uniref:phospholipase D n=1 Tax=Denitromonas halophila TaxID=1629404 RepID=A0A557QFE6_9RHOO|nr:phospholipase D-like domain-containing protein [Denitromonas halophila]TVO51631.1 nuclease [Denitromonas halophila]
MPNDTPTIDDVLAHLNASIEDVRLSDEERRTLTTLLRDAVTPEDGLRRVRNRAFDLVRTRLGEGREALDLLRWLDGVARALDMARTPLIEGRTEVSFSPGDDCLNMVLTRFQLARQTVRICVFTIADNRISEAILAAHQRGVEIRILTDNDKRFDAGSDIAQLRAAGIPVVEDRSNAHMHHKFAIFDDLWLLNGSFNWTRSASQANEENLVLSNDPAMCTPFTARFEHLWARFSS